MVILGIDPGLSRCGYACLEPAPRRTVRAVALGVIRTPAADPLPQRLAELRAELAALIAELRPDVVAVEQVFFQVNVRTAMSVGQASGLALAEAAAAGCEVVQYTPNQVKEAVAGWGAADKAQVQKMVQARLGLSDAAASRPTPPTPPRWRCATWPWPRCRRRVAAAARRRGDDRLAARHGARARHRRPRCCSRSAASATASRSRRAPSPSSSRGATAFLHVHHHIREDAQTLYGFLSRDERAAFEVLIGTHGVGPALALAILATHSPSALRRHRRRRRPRRAARSCPASARRRPSACWSS